MKGLPVILIFDIGKTNKKILLFDEEYRLVHEESVHFEEIKDEDGDDCEDIYQLTEWVKSSFHRIISLPQFSVKAVNVSAHGASFVYVDEDLKPLLPLYNYLKQYPAKLQEQFYKTYGGESEFAKKTASPVLGSLNSGMQVYRLKHERPEAFNKIKYVLHLPQYLSAVLTKRACSDITSIGCHTNLWDFSTNDYHEWVFKEGIHLKLAPILRSDECIQVQNEPDCLCIGVGLHDSSAALIPYLANFHEPFVLLSTGTWSISLNPFNHTALTTEELEMDCLCYFTYNGTPVKASRLFAGHEHEQQLKRISEYYHIPVDHFTNLEFDSINFRRLKQMTVEAVSSVERNQLPVFADRELNEFKSGDDAYKELIIDIVTRQLMSTKLVLSGTDVKRIFVDGGFSKNSIYMHLMAAAFPNIEVYAASIAQASALGAALAIHKHWNNKQIPADLIELKLFSGSTKDLHT